jgi:DNA polymerase III subunit delta
MSHATFEELLERLKKGKASPGIVLLGTDPYLRQRCRSALIERFVPVAAREWGVMRIAARGDGLDELLGRARMVPMLSPAQVLILQDVEALEKGGEASGEKSAEAIEAYFSDPAPYSKIIFEAENLDKRRRLYKVLAAHAIIVELTAGVGDAALLASEMARDRGTELDPHAAEALAEAVNGEIAKIDLELEKLSLYAAGRKIEVADVDALVVSAQKQTVWQLTNVLAEGKREKALDFLDSLLSEGEAPAQIVGALTWMYRKLVEASELPSAMNPYQASRELGMRPDSAGIALAQSRKIPRRALLAGIVALAEADSELKSGTSNPRAVMEFLVARLTTTGPTARA